MSRTGLMCLALAVAAAPCRLAGQQRTAELGDWVRVTLVESSLPTIWGRQWQGELLRAGEDTIYIDPDGPQDRRAVSLRDLKKLERYVGRHGHAGTGALVGAGVGLVAGVVALFPSSSADCDDGVDCPADPGVEYAPLGTVPICAGIGALIGLVIRSDHWEKVGIPPVSLAPLVTPDRFGIALRIGR